MHLPTTNSHLMESIETKKNIDSLTIQSKRGSTLQEFVEDKQ